MIQLPQPSTITKDQAKKILKAAGYLAASTAISYLISVVTDDPTLFGPLTPLINVLLVSVKQIFTTEQ